MSTKIYNGYISKLSIEQLLKKFIVLVPQFEEKKKEFYHKSLAEEATFAIDKEVYKQGKRPEGDRQFRILHEIHDKNEKAIKNAILMHTKESNDFSANCCVFPMGKRKTLILFYCEDNTLTEMWRNLPFISEYHYQNQTDQPSEISNKDWNQRRKDWDKAVGWDTARERGYCFQFTIERLPFPRTSECMKYVPGLAKRRLNLLHDNFVDAEFKKQMSKHKKEKPQEDPSIFSFYRIAKDKWFAYKKTPAFKKDLKGIPLISINFETSPAKKSEALNKAIKSTK